MWDGLSSRRACWDVLCCLLCACMLQAAIHSVVAGGRVVTVGMGCDHAHLPVSTINCKEIDLMGSFRYANTVSLAFLSPRLC